MTERPPPVHGDIDGDVWLDADRADVDALRVLLDRATTSSDVPRAIAIERGIPVYDGASVDAAASDERAAAGLMAEWHRVLASGAGVLAIRGAWPVDVIARSNAVFEALLAAAPDTGGDHFATPGSNARLWNAHEKLALADPEVFVDYTAVPTLALAATAWLGPAYQVTAQLNLVRPGGRAQQPHRDYHLGFQSRDQVARYPATVHRLSPALTLQGAVAHARMPVESGPTQLLPHSQTWLPGYLASGQDEVRALFAERHVQLALEPGDAVFFNPALLHAAGDNVSADVQRLAKLLQIGSAFGRAMEIVDRQGLVEAIYPALLARVDSGALDDLGAARVVAASAEGYPFPANLDFEPPVDGAAPPSQQDRVLAALARRDSPAALHDALDAQAALKRSR